MTSLISGILEQADFGQSIETPTTDTQDNVPSIFENLLNQFTNSGSSQEPSELNDAVNTLTNITETGRALFSPHAEQNNLPQIENETEIQSQLLNALMTELIHSQASKTSSAETDTATTNAEPETKLSTFEQLSFGENGLDIGDAFDAFNALNHIPIVSDIYSSVTSEKVSRGASLAGSYILGGPSGMIFSSLNMITEAATGKSIFGNVADAATQLFQEPSNLSDDSSQSGIL